jgi:hypothetical protein
MDIGRTPVTERCRYFFIIATSSYFCGALLMVVSLVTNTGFSTSFTRISFVLAYFGGSRYTVPGARPSELLFVPSNVHLR